MTERKTKIRITYLMLGFAAVAAMGAHVYGLWRLSQEEKKLVPRLALNTLTKAVLTHHKKAGRFPETLSDIDARTWQRKQVPDISQEGHSLYLAHYFYLYYAPAPTVCNIWAIPSGRRREEASTHFLALSPYGIRRWKGPALSVEDLKQISFTPTLAQLAALGLTEQQPIYFKQNFKTRRRS